MLGLKLNHVSKRGHWMQVLTVKDRNQLYYVINIMTADTLGDGSHQGIHSHDIDLIFLEYCGLRIS